MPGLPGSASPPAVDYRREVFARESGERAAELVASGGPLPRDVMTRGAFLNAIAVSMALAGSTNSVLHLLAIAREAHVGLDLDDFDLGEVALHDRDAVGVRLVVAAVRRRPEMDDADLELRIRGRRVRGT